MTSSALVRVLVVDDHPVFRIGMVALLEELDNIAVVGESATEGEAVAAAAELAPDVVLMDLDLRGGSGVMATREILRERPGTGVLVVTMFADDEALIGAIRAGARGYVLKGATPGEVERAIRSVAEGGVMIGPQVASHALDYLTGAQGTRGGVFSMLTDRERDVLELVARGHDNSTIARMLVLTPKTIRNYVAAIFTKLDVNDRATLIVRAREAGIGVTRPETGGAAN